VKQAANQERCVALHGTVLFQAAESGEKQCALKLRFKWSKRSTECRL